MEIPEMRFKKCKTVKQLITELQKLPPNLKLDEPVTPVHYNTGKLAKELGLKQSLGFDED